MNDTTYKILFFLHIASIVVAFAPAVMAVLPGGAAGATATLRESGRTVYNAALILAGLFGIGLIFSSDDVWAFDQTWISLAFLVWIAMLGVFHVMVLAGKGPRPRGGSAVGQVDPGEAVLTLLFVVQLYLMIWKPGA